MIIIRTYRSSFHQPTTDRLFAIVKVSSFSESKEVIERSRLLTFISKKETSYPLETNLFNFSNNPKVKIQTRRLIRSEVWFDVEHFDLHFPELDGGKHCSSRNLSTSGSVKCTLSAYSFGHMAYRLGSAIRGMYMGLLAALKDFGKRQVYQIDIILDFSYHRTFGFFEATAVLPRRIILWLGSLTSWAISYTVIFLQLNSDLSFSS